MFKNWNPEDLIITFRDVIVDGFAEDSMVDVARNEDAFTTTVGSGGAVVRNANANKTGTVTIHLLRESPTNSRFSSYLGIDEATGLGYGAIQVKDLNGTVLAHAEEAWIKKVPDIGFAKETKPQAWVFECASLEVTLAGANF